MQVPLLVKLEAAPVSIGAYCVHPPIRAQPARTQQRMRPPVLVPSRRALGRPLLAPPPRRSAGALSLASPPTGRRISPGGRFVAGSTYPRRTGGARVPSCPTGRRGV